MALLNQHTLHTLEVIGGSLLAAVWILELSWVRIDSRRRVGRRLGRLAAALLGTIPLLGVLLYLLLRPHDTVLERQRRSSTQRFLLFDQDLRDIAPIGSPPTPLGS